MSIDYYSEITCKNRYSWVCHRDTYTDIIPYADILSEAYFLNKNVFSRVFSRELVDLPSTLMIDSPTAAEHFTYPSI